MKKLELTKKQKKILTASLIGSGIVVSMLGAWAIISRTEFGHAVKDELISRLLESIASKNKVSLIMQTYISNSVTTNDEVKARAFQEAWAVFNDTITSAKLTKH